MPERRKNGGPAEMGSPFRYIPAETKCRVEERRMRFLLLHFRDAHPG
jgi:hypothetical protein